MAGLSTRLETKVRPGFPERKPQLGITKTSAQRTCRFPGRRRQRVRPDRRARRRLHRVRSLALGVPVRLRLRLGLHLGEAGVVIRELVQVGPRNLRRHDDVIASDIRLRITRAMLEFHVHPHPELLEIKRRGAPFDADPLTRGAGLIGGEA
jgi:hypothetical protein